MEFEHKIIEEIREEFEIPDDLTAYQMDHNIWNSLENKSNVRVLFKVAAVNNHNTKKERLNHWTNSGHMKGDGFEMVSVEMITEYENKQYDLVFTKDIEKFYQKYLKGQYTPPPPMVVQPGVYRPVRGMMGWQLSQVPLGDTVKPILNHNLFDLLSNEIQAFMEKEDVYKDVGVDYKRGIMLYGQPGNGKCLARDTPVLMFDGTIKKVQEVEVGDKIMGPDSTPRNVLSIASGKEEMYKVVPTKGEPYTVNESHILSLISSHKGTIHNVNVKDYYENPKTNLKGYRVGVDFESKDLLVDPYFVGIWLGDGTKDEAAVTTPDKEIVSWLKGFADKNSLKVRKVELDNNKADTYFLTTGNKHNSRNLKSLKVKLRMIGVLGNKHIPHNYLSTSREDRLRLLAGLIDSDGHLHDNNCYEIICKVEKLSDDILFLCRSLGFAAYKSLKQVKYKGENREYYKVNISGNTNTIPVKIMRKKALQRKQAKSVLRTGISVKPIGSGEYYGFEIDGDGLFLLGDFTVTHNTTFIKHLLHQLDGAVCVLMNSNDEDVVGFMEFFMALPNAKDMLKVIVIEDIDGMDNCNRSRLLNFLDGIQPIHKAVFIATTNFPDNVDMALKERPSRFDSIYNIGLPNATSRKKLLKMYFKDLKDADMDKCIVESKGFSGAFFKEFYIISKLNDWDAIQAITEVKRRRELFK